MVSNKFSCGCVFSYDGVRYSWDICELHGSVYLMQKRIEELELAVTKALSALKTNPITGDRTAYTVLKNIVSCHEPTKLKSEQ